MIATLLPRAAVTAEAGPGDWSAPLLPTESALVARAVEKRRREFSAGRSCARRALERLGLRDVPILAGPRREPLWPPGIAGSITHCSGYCAAAVARMTDLGGIGIDAELRAPLDQGVVDLVCTGNEMAWARAQRGDHWPALIFSAKESIFKVWYPIAGRWLDYRDAELTIDAVACRFSARLLVSDLPAGFPAHVDGRFLVDDQRVYTSVALPARVAAVATGPAGQKG
jgi:4'-phosphopantetheinyl transferase EntD